MVSKAWQMAYDQAIVRQGADMGGSVRTGVNAVVNALQALAGGDIRAALAQGAAPYLAAKVKELTTGNAPYGELTDTQKLNNLMAHALLGGVVAELSGGSAAAGATGAVTGELAAPAIALALYGTADSDKLSPEQKANLSALATLASGIAAGVSSGSTAGAATGALAGKNAVENNNLAAVVRLGATACAEIASCRNMVVEKGLGALLGLGVAKTAMDNLSEADRTLILAAAMTGKADEIERLTPAQQAVYKEMVESQKGTLLPLPVLDRPLVDNTLTNPIPGQDKGTTLTTPDQRDQNGSSHTGNTSGVPDTAGNTIITPIPDGPSKDDLAYLALKGKEAQKAASDLGFGNKIPAPKVPFNSHGQPAFYNGKVYITPDIDSHNVTNSWKMFDRKGNRLGTYDSSLNRIKD